MKREVTTTKDGSKTLFISNLNESYHSHHGALQEAQHVFIDHGLKSIKNCEINILELGFGTGLNFLATIAEFLKTDKYHVIRYFTIEKYPVTIDEINALEYDMLYEDPEISRIYAEAHQNEWNKTVELIPGFFLTKIKADFHELNNKTMPEIDMVYYDCFGARVQPDLWEKPLLEAVANKMRQGGLFTTYASKGSVRRDLQSLGFTVQKLAGPPGKREMMNAIKTERVINDQLPRAPL